MKVLIDHRERGVLQRGLREIHAGGQHSMVGDSAYSRLGQILLGDPHVDPMDERVAQSPCLIQYEGPCDCVEPWFCSSSSCWPPFRFSSVYMVYERAVSPTAAANVSGGSSEPRAPPCGALDDYFDATYPELQDLVAGHPSTSTSGGCVTSTTRRRELQAAHEEWISVQSLRSFGAATPGHAGALRGHPLPSTRGHGRALPRPRRVTAAGDVSDLFTLPDVEAPAASPSGSRWCGTSRSVTWCLLPSTALRSPGSWRVRGTIRGLDPVPNGPPVRRRGTVLRLGAHGGRRGSASLSSQDAGRRERCLPRGLERTASTYGGLTAAHRGLAGPSGLAASAAAVDATGTRPLWTVLGVGLVARSGRAHSSPSGSAATSTVSIQQHRGGGEPARPRRTAASRALPSFARWATCRRAWWPREENGPTSTTSYEVAFLPSRQPSPTSGAGLWLPATSIRYWQADAWRASSPRRSSAEFVSLLERLPDAAGLRLRDGEGWPPGMMGTFTVPSESDTPAGHTLRSHEPVFIADLRQQFGTAAAPVVRDLGIVSGVTVIVEGADTPWGVLGAYTTQPSRLRARGRKLSPGGGQHSGRPDRALARGGRAGALCRAPGDPARDRPRP